MLLNLSHNFFLQQFILLGFNQCPCLPKAELNTKNETKRPQTATSQWPVGFVFGVQLDYSCRLKSVPSDGINRVVGSFMTSDIATWNQFFFCYVQLRIHSGQTYKNLRRFKSTVHKWESRTTLALPLHGRGGVSWHMKYNLKWFFSAFSK